MIFLSRRAAITIILIILLLLILLIANFATRDIGGDVNGDINNTAETIVGDGNVRAGGNIEVQKQGNE